MKECDEVECMIRAPGDAIYIYTSEINGHMIREQYHLLVCRCAQAVAVLWGCQQSFRSMLLTK